MLSALALLAVGAAVFATAGLLVRNHYRKTNQVVPGVDSPAPTNWAGSHDPEARLHRRLRDAVASLRLSSSNRPARRSTVAIVEADALEIDHQLVAASLLSSSLKKEALGDLTSAVERVEEAASGLLEARTAASEESVIKQLETLAIQLEAMRQARSDVDAADKQGRRQAGAP